MRLLLAWVLLVVASGCAEEGVHDRIADIKADPMRYQQRQVFLRGEAVEIRAPAGFQLAEDGLFAEDIFVLTPSHLVQPRAGEWLELRGAVRHLTADVEDEYSLQLDGPLESSLKGRPVVIALQTLR